MPSKRAFWGYFVDCTTDPNEGMYPLAWAHVEAENNSSWDWFLGLIKADLSIENSGTYTFISDRQKVNIYIQ